MILMLIKYQSLKKNNMVNIIHLDTLFGKFDKNKITMSLMIKDIQLFKKYNKIWKKI